MSRSHERPMSTSTGANMGSDVHMSAEPAA
jgi:hypothetical protein